MEEYASGRILPKFAADVVGSTTKTLPQKCDNILLTTNTWNYIKKNKSIVGSIIQQLKATYGYSLITDRMFIDCCHNYVCCIPDAVSENGDVILLVKSKAVPSGSITEHAKNKKTGIGVRQNGDEWVLDRKTLSEAQIALHASKASAVILFFVNTNDLNDYIVKVVERDDDYYSKVESNLQDFFEQFLLKQVIKRDTIIKN